MAGQFAVAHSSIVTGAGLVAGGPYYCAGHPGQAPDIPYMTNALKACMNPVAWRVDPPDARVLWERTREFARAGLIDDVAYLRRQSIFLFTGAKDQIVSRAVVAQARDFYRLAGTQRIRYVDSVQAGHGMVTDNSADAACGVTAEPYFVNCRLRLAQDILAYLYPDLRPAAARASGRTIRFDQRRYAARASGMAELAYAYVPAACERERCRVHIAFHGCRQGATIVGDHFYARAGYNPVADTNKLIVLYPQVAASTFSPYNPLGCWDFWGYSSANKAAPDYHTRNGAQVKAVRAMLERLAQPRAAAVRHWPN